MLDQIRDFRPLTKFWEENAGVNIEAQSLMDDVDSDVFFHGRIEELCVGVLSEDINITVTVGRQGIQRFRPQRWARSFFCHLITKCTSKSRIGNPVPLQWSFLGQFAFLTLPLQTGRIGDILVGWSLPCLTVFFSLPRMKADGFL